MNTLKLGNYGINSGGGVSKPNGNPSGLTLTVLSDTSIQLDWTNGATNQDGTRIYGRLLGVGSFVEYGTALGALKTKTLTGLTENTSYEFYVVAYKGSKESGASNTVTVWMPVPYFALPENGVSLLSGQEVTIYGDTLINIPIINDLEVEYTCDIGTQSGNNYVINPTDLQEGIHPLTATFKNYGTQFLTQTINLTVYKEIPTGNRKILIIGDSIIEGGISNYQTQISSILSNTSLTFLGTKGTVYKHEGYGGFSFNSFITDHAAPVSPFMKSGILDISSYFADNSIDTPDYIFIRLGVNDTFSYCNKYVDEITDGQITSILNNAKIFIDALLAYNSGIKIILSIPTICENSGNGWNLNYDETYYIQNTYIRNIHKYWSAFIAYYSNEVYSPRVSCSYESIILDRNDGYPKIEGIHTNGVHPSSTGYDELGAGMAIYFNKLIGLDLIPTELTSSWVDDYAQIDFIDNTGGVGEHEIYESKNGGSYALVTTLGAGVTHYHNLTWQNANMNFKVRAKIGTWYSDYSSVVNLITPLIIKTDQSTNANVIFNLLYILPAKTVNIDWGDGTNANYTGNNVSITKSYSTQQNPFYIKISGDVNSIFYLRHVSQIKSYGDIGKWILPTSLMNLYLYGNTFTGDISNWILPIGLKEIDISANAFTGNISNWILPIPLTYFKLGPHNGSAPTGDISNWVLPPNIVTIDIPAYFTYKLSGDLSGWSMPSSLTQLYATGNGFTKLPRGSFLGIKSSLGYYCNSNVCSSDEIENLLAYIDNYFITNIPIKNANYKLDGAGMGVANANAIASKASIEAKYIAAGFVATITVN